MSIKEDFKNVRQQLQNLLSKLSNFKLTTEEISSRFGIVLFPDLITIYKP